MAKLVFEHSGEELYLEDNSPIKEACEDAGVPFACTEGVCGTCVVEVVSGEDGLSEPTEEEKDFLGDDVLDERLACQCRILRGNVTLTF